MKKFLKQGNASKRRHYLLALCLLCAGGFAMAQEQTVSGK